MVLAELVLRPLPMSVAALAGSGVGVCAVVGFPHGNSHPDLTAAEAIRAMAAGSANRLALVRTGAEIRACCRLSALLDVPLLQAAQNVVPVAVTAAESVDRLRNWASGRCLSASVPGLYQRAGTTTNATGRRVSRSAAN